MTTESDERVERGALTIVGTATVLLRCAGFTLLTDPNFLHQGEHAKLGYGLRSKRLTEPAMSIGELPPLDFIVLSHHHGDHFDDVAAAELRRDVPIVTEPHAARKLRRQGFTHPIALRTWEQHTLTHGRTAVTVTALPAKHAPQPLRTSLPSVMGSMLFASAGRPVLCLDITGDTLLHHGLRAIADRYPQIDLGVIQLGGTRIAGVLLTMDDRQGIEALRLLHPRTAVPCTTTTTRSSRARLLRSVAAPTRPPCRARSSTSSAARPSSSTSPPPDPEAPSSLTASAQCGMASPPRWAISGTCHMVGSAVAARRITVFGEWPSPGSTANAMARRQPAQPNPPAPLGPSFVLNAPGWTGLAG